jgi:XTP/dITP diphosphohydrolase
MELLIASNNPGKLREVARLLAGLPVEVLRPADLGIDLDPQETGDSFAANARIKARAFARASGLLALADDSGLEVPALGGWPGVHSARFAGPAADDARRRELLVARLAGHPPADWGARFVSHVAIARGADVVAEATGALLGRIVPAARGRGGFGYDPIFQPDGDSRTLAELTPDEKNAVSHRGRAIAQLRPFLARLAAP